LILGCLAKDPERRQQSAHDVLLELRWIAEGGSQSSFPAPLWLPLRRWRLAPSIAAGLLLIAALAGGLLYLSRRSKDEQRVLRVSVLPPEKSSFVASSLPAVSPDGRRVVFSANTEGRVQLFVRDLDLLATKALPGTDGADNPFWSPDGRAVAFFARGKLRRVELAGGPAGFARGAGP